MLCGITCLKMVCKYYGAFYSIEFLSSLCKEGREGISLLAMSKGADSLGLKNTRIRVKKVLLKVGNLVGFL